MRFGVPSNTHSFPSVNFTRQLALSWIDLKRMTGFARSKHYDRKLRRSGGTQKHSLCTSQRVEKYGKAPAAVFLLNHPITVPSAVPQVVSEPVNAVLGLSIIIHFEAHLSQISSLSAFWLPPALLCSVFQRPSTLRAAK